MKTFLHKIRYTALLENPVVNCAIYLLVGLFTLRTILMEDGAIGHRLDWWIPYYSVQFKQLVTEAMYKWHESTFGFDNVFKVDAYVSLLLGAMGYLGIGGGAVSKGLILFVISLSGSSMFFLIRELLSDYLTDEGKHNQEVILPAFMGGLFYALSPILFTQVVGGARDYIICYPFFPLAFLYFYKSVKGSRIRVRYMILSALFYSIASIQNQFVLFLFAVLVIYILLTGEWLLKLKSLAGILAIVFFVHSYWLFPFIYYFEMNKSVMEAPASNPAALENLVTHAPPLYKVFTMIAWFDPLFESAVNSNLEPVWYLASTAFLFLALLPVVFMRNRLVLSCGITILLFVFLAKGGGPPFGSINMWFYENFTIFQLFRSLHHFLIVPAFCFSILFGFAICYLTQRYEGIRRSCTVLLILLIIIIYLHPILSGDFGGSIQTFKESPSYLEISQEVLKEPTDSRMMFLPCAGSVLWADSKYKSSGMDALVALPPKATLYADIFPEGNSKKFAQFLEYFIYEDATQDLSKLLGLANIQYLVVRKKIGHPHVAYGRNFWRLPFAFEMCRQILENQENIKLVKEYEDAVLYENKSFLPHIYASTDNVIVSSGRTTLLDLAETGYLDKPVALIYPQLQPPNTLIEMFENKDLWNHTSLFDLTTKELVQALIERAFSSLVLQLDKKLQFRVKESGLHEIWCRASEDSRLSIDDKEVARFQGGDPDDISWVKMGEVSLSKGDHYAVVNDAKTFCSELKIFPKQKFMGYLDEEPGHRKYFADKRPFFHTSTSQGHNGKTSVAKQMGEYPSDVLLIKVKRSGLHLDGFQDWKIHRAANCEYQSSFQEGDLVIDVNFDGKGEEDEYVELVQTLPRVDLEKTPVMMMNYMVDDFRVQDVWVTFWVEDRRKKKLEELSFPAKTSVLATQSEGQTLIIDAYERFKERWPKQKKFLIKKISIYLGKLDDVDCSKPGKKGKYSFRLAGVKFIKEVEYPPFGAGGPAWSVADFLGRAQYVYKPGILPYLDIEKYPIVSLNMATGITLRKGYFDVSLNLDLDADNHPESKVDCQLPIIHWGGIEGRGGNGLYFNAYQLVKKRFPGKSSYRLFSIELTNPSVRALRWEYSTFSMQNEMYQKVEAPSEPILRKVDVQPFIPQIEVEKINPTKYLVTAKGARGPFTLVFIESFHPGWIAYKGISRVKDKSPWKKLALFNLPFGHEKGSEFTCHFVANGHANAWWIPVEPSEAGRDLDIVLEYEPQKTFEFGCLISSLTIFVCLGIVLWSREGRR